MPQAEFCPLIPKEEIVDCSYVYSILLLLKIRWVYFLRLNQML